MDNVGIASLSGKYLQQPFKRNIEAVEDVKEESNQGWMNGCTKVGQEGRTGDLASEKTEKMLPPFNWAKTIIKIIDIRTSGSFIAVAIRQESLGGSKTASTLYLKGSAERLSGHESPPSPSIAFRPP
jgi:hypothetical protein